VRAGNPAVPGATRHFPGGFLRSASRFGPGAGLGERSSRLTLALSLGAVFAFVLLITLPFANQAFHIDDAIFWDFAKLNLESPLQQDLPEYRLMGVEIPNWRDTHPPLDQLYMSAIMRVTGSDAELPLHLGFIIFPAITGISMFFLARRFTRNALPATLLLLATPAIMAASHTLMGDLPMTALWMAATALYISGVDRDSGWLLALAGLTAMLAVFAGYQALALILLLPAYSWLKGRLNWKTGLPLLLPVAGFGAYALYSLARYNALPRFKHAKGLSIEGSSVLARIEGNLLQLGGASVFPLILAGVFCLRRRRWLMLAPIIAAASGLALYYYNSISNFPLATAALFVLFLSTGALVIIAIWSEVQVQLVQVFKDRRADTDFFFLAFWFFVMFAAIALLLPHATAKYMLPFLAPLILLFFREIEAGIKSASVLTGVFVAAVALTFLAGTAVSAADYQLAQTYKDFAQDLGDRYHPEGTVWFVGEWGFRHYMEAEGYRYLTSASTAPREGDLVVRVGLMDWPLDHSVTDQLSLVGSSAAESGSPLRVMSLPANAGFYGTHWGKLPFTFSVLPVERLDVYRVGPPV